MNLTALLGLGLLVAIGVIAYLFATNSSGSAKAPAAAARSTRQASPKPTHSASPAAAPTTGTPVVALTPASATAFGPGGTGQGDNPQLASQALSGNTAQAWHTNWYTTPQFGGLQDGTGLLLDMGKQVTITSAEVTLGSMAGADLQLRAGNVPTLSGLHPVAQVNDAGGAVLMHLGQPVRGRYLLIWFTRLPPNNAGTFEAWISDVRLKGMG